LLLKGHKLIVHSQESNKEQNTGKLSTEEDLSKIGDISTIIADANAIVVLEDNYF